MKAIYLKLILACLLCTLFISKSGWAQIGYEDDGGGMSGLDIGLFGSAALLDNDKFYPGGGLEVYKRYNRWSGTGIRLSYHRLTNLNSNWFQMPQFFWDVHLLKEGRFDLFIGNGIGYSRFNGFNGFDNTFRLGANFWVSQRIGIAFLLNYSLIIHGSPNPNDTIDRDGALGLSGGVRIRF